ncbi:hypothetical protein EIP91_002823 [Steccherinum ochraceum]|uniref:P-loop containing nucleoside triphosphate hydrolase protein n=1 Tax=Steccherinum ochraceum TaxID=92696 RepID=A0A4R0RN69_9APHY|nr:hypothetical protein EIP91_002823 [Steccherinum ochraceum]
MRRPADLTVDTASATPSTTDEPTTSPKLSECKLPSSSRTSVLSVNPSVNIPTPSPPQPSVRLLFSLLARRELLVFVLPAVLTSMFAGGIAPFMTLVVGQAFDAYSKFTVASDPDTAKHALLHDVGMTAVELLALAVGALALSSLTSCLWIWTGERNLMAVRKQVYEAVSKKDMIWYDTKMGSEDSVKSTDGPVGAGGLMAQFARETDDVRMASSLASGMLVQYLTTTITCLILALVRSWSLTLVILSTVPVMMIIQALSQGFVGPALTAERAHIASAATLVDRAVAAISTVKAFNAEIYEQKTISLMLEKMQSAAIQCIRIWGITSSLSQFVMMTMFVQAFWFGSKLVREGKVSMGDVTAVFWACLIASSNLQMCIPQFIVFAKGKFAMASLMAVVDSTATSAGSKTNSVALSRRPTNLRKILPRGCQGGLELTEVTFFYPSRPTIPTLDDVSIFLPAGETTFIVGGSGSGKSTIAHLLLRLYDNYSGTIALDDQDLAFLDENWTRQHVSAVSQTTILFDMTVHENVAMGLAGPYSTRRPEDVTREEIEEVCRIALVHDFVRDLPQGYDTPLGNGGANLSGGQKQRLAIARAILRKPTVLILDEATSALDATSRILVFEALKRNRSNKTTVVITHDLSQICASDFVYVLKDGGLAEQGFRYDLESHDGEFRRMATVQGAIGGFPQQEEVVHGIEVEAILDRQDEEKSEEFEAIGINSNTLHRPSVYRPITVSNWMLDVIADLTKPAPTDAVPTVGAPREPHRVSRFVPAEAFTAAEEPVSPSFRRSMHVSIPPPPPAVIKTNRRLSLPVTPTSPAGHSTASFFSATVVNDDDEMDMDRKSVLTIEKAGWAAKKRSDSSSMVSSTKRTRLRWDEKSLNGLTEVKVDTSSEASTIAASQSTSSSSIFGFIRETYPTIPHKPFLFFGIVVCMISGAMTPIFSYLLSQLLFQVSIGAQNVSVINTYGGIVLAVAAADGLFIGGKYVVMELVALKWVIALRRRCIKLILAQDKKWFDQPGNTPVRLMQVLVKDGDDARTLIATVLAQFFVVIAMLGIGLVWALVLGWQLTLVGFAIAPVFAVAMAVQTKLVSKCSMRNKRAREEVATGYYDAISNVRAIRAMGFETAFQEKFDKSVDRALSTGVRGAFVEGCTYGVASALIYLAEALLFYVGAVLIANGTYSYLRMIQVLNLVVFSVSIGSQLMAFTSRIAKSVQATQDLLALLKLTSDTEESRGDLQPPILGNVSFQHVAFSYPERPDVPILKDISLELGDGECVAIVGASGSGKSTIAALLQRLYEPTAGRILLGPHTLSSTDVHHLREHVAVVSQHPNLFDATIAANIAYGDTSLSADDIQAAAKAAHVHDFISSLPKGYDTMVGENASLISGGQAQRICIARALARAARILILDECTSALDPENQQAVMETIKHAKVGRTTLMVTHKLPVMRMCDRIVVVHDGVVAEQGSYDELISRRGVFAQLASGGEWMD